MCHNGRIGSLHSHHVDGSSTINVSAVRQLDACQQCYVAIAEVIISLVDGIVAQLTFSVLIVRKLDILHVVVEVCNVVWEDPHFGDPHKKSHWMEITGWVSSSPRGVKPTLKRLT